MILRTCLLTFLLAVSNAAGAAFAQAPDDLPAPAAKADVGRYQIDTHDFSYNGHDYEIFLKLDRHTGQTWKFNASSPKWTLIAEAKEGPAPEATDHNRFELFVHDYTTDKGAAEEMFIRLDKETGQSWTFRGINPAWQPLGEGETPPAQTSTVVEKGAN